MEDDHIYNELHKIIDRLQVINVDDDPFYFDGDIMTCTSDGVPIRKLFVGNLAQRTTHKDLENLFSKFGSIDSCYLKRNVGKSNFAFVTFNHVKDAIEATKEGYHKNIILHHRQLRVMPADSWHQPDSVDKLKILLRRKAGNVSAEQNDTEDTGYILNEDAEIHRLNDDCLLHIFTFLPIVDRVRMERVCKRWRTISNESWRTFKRLENSQSSWGSNIRNGRHVPCTIDTPTLRKVLLRCGQFLTHINFSNFNEKLNSSTVTVVGRMCPNLQCIDVSALNVSASGITSLTKNCQNIAEFTLGRCTSPYDNELIELFKKNRKLRYLKITENNIIGKCLFYLPPESIETIILDHCNNLWQSLVSTAIKHFPKLHTLMLDNCISVDDQMIRNISSLPSLKVLQLRDFFPMMQTETMLHIAALTNLEALNVSKNRSVNNEFLLAVGSTCKKLVNVDISCCEEITNSGLEGIASLPKLEHLSVNYLDSITDELFGEMTHLKTLHCRGCVGLGDAGLSALVENAQNLELLDLSGCKNVGKSFLDAAVKATKCRANNLVLKVFVGGIPEIAELGEDSQLPVSPFLSVLKVDLAVDYFRLRAFKNSSD